VLQVREALRIQRGRQTPLLLQEGEQLPVDRFTDSATVQPRLEREIVVDTTLDDALVDQTQHAVDKHFRGHVEPDIEALRPYRRLGSDGVIEQRPISRIVPLAQDQRMGHRVAERTDPDLQRTAVDDKRAGVQRRGIVRGRYRHVRNGKQAPVPDGIARQGGTATQGQTCVVFHEGKLGCNWPMHT
jgi:hypothetical protein